MLRPFYRRALSDCSNLQTTETYAGEQCSPLRRYASLPEPRPDSSTPAPTGASARNDRSRENPQSSKQSLCKGPRLAGARRGWHRQPGRADKRDVLKACRQARKAFEVARRHIPRKQQKPTGRAMLSPTSLREPSILAKSQVMHAIACGIEPPVHVGAGIASPVVLISATY